MNYDCIICIVSSVIDAMMLENIANWIGWIWHLKLHNHVMSLLPLFWFLTTTILWFTNPEIFSPQKERSRNMGDALYPFEVHFSWHQCISLAKSNHSHPEVNAFSLRGWSSVDKQNSHILGNSWWIWIFSMVTESL